MMYRLLVPVLTTLSLMACSAGLQPAAQSTATDTSAEDQANLFADWQPDAATGKFEGYVDGFTQDEELEDFFHYHKRFGLIRHPDNYQQFILIGKEAELTNQVIKAMAVFSGSSPGLATPFAEQLIDSDEGVAFDVTKIVDPYTQEAHARWPMNHGPNCWNFAMRITGLTAGYHNADEIEMQRLAASPLLQRIDDPKAVRPGDMVVYRTREKMDGMKTHESHASIILSPDLMLSKNGVDEDVQWYLQDANDVNLSYLDNQPRSCFSPKSRANEACESYTEFYRVADLGEYLADVHPKLKMVLSRSYEIEMQMTNILLEPLDPDQPLLQPDEVQEIRKYLRPAIFKLRDALVALKTDESLTDKDQDFREVLLYRQYSLFHSIYAGPAANGMEEFLSYSPGE